MGRARERIDYSSYTLEVFLYRSYSFVYVLFLLPGRLSSSAPRGLGLLLICMTYNVLECEGYTMLERSVTSWHRVAVHTCADANRERFGP